MTDMLISIKPEFAEKILAGEKTVELRKRLPIKRIVGRFIVGVFKHAAFGGMCDIFKRACVPYTYAQAYYGNPSDFEHCEYIEIAKVERYAVPVDPRAVNPHFTAPQSWCYFPDAARYIEHCTNVAGRPKPCPVCGKEPDLCHISQKQLVYIWCPCCGLHTPIFYADGATPDEIGYTARNCVARWDYMVDTLQKWKGGVR